MRLERITILDVEYVPRKQQTREPKPRIPTQEPRRGLESCCPRIGDCLRTNPGACTGDYTSCADFYRSNC